MWQVGVQRRGAFQDAARVGLLQGGEPVALTSTAVADMQQEFPVFLR